VTITTMLVIISYLSTSTKRSTPTVKQKTSIIVIDKKQFD